MKITRKQMVNAVGNVDKVDILLHYINIYLDVFEINTPLRAAHFMAQCCHETGGLKFLKEKGNSKYFKKYEQGRLGKMLGNTQAGDGEKYKGRGLLHLTGRSNYKAYQKSGYCKGDIIENPELLEQPIGAIKSGMWWWMKHKLNALADKDAFEAITRRVNGGTNGLEDRGRWLRIWKKELCA